MKCKSYTNLEFLDFAEKPVDLEPGSSGNSFQTAEPEVEEEEEELMLKPVVDLAVLGTKPEAELDLEAAVTDQLLTLISGQLVVHANKDELDPQVLQEMTDHQETMGITEAQELQEKKDQFYLLLFHHLNLALFAHLVLKDQSVNKDHQDQTVQKENQPREPKTARTEKWE